jgi:hypothetical protein
MQGGTLLLSAGFEPEMTLRDSATLARRHALLLRPADGGWQRAVVDPRRLED